MSEMIENVGLAALNGLLDRRGIKSELEAVRDDDPELWTEIVRESGRAAIEAMREPTEIMLVAGYDAWAYVDSTQLHSWRAMIDMALGRRGDWPTAKRGTDG